MTLKRMVALLAVLFVAGWASAVRAQVVPSKIQVAPSKIPIAKEVGDLAIPAGNLKTKILWAGIDCVKGGPRVIADQNGQTLGMLMVGAERIEVAGIQNELQYFHPENLSFFCPLRLSAGSRIMTVEVHGNIRSGGDSDTLGYSVNFSLWQTGTSWLFTQKPIDQFGSFDIILHPTQILSISDNGPAYFVIDFNSEKGIAGIVGSDFVLNSIKISYTE